MLKDVDIWIDFEDFKRSKTTNKTTLSAPTFTSDLKSFTLSVGVNRPPGLSRIIAWVLLPWALLLLSCTPSLSWPDLFVEATLPFFARMEVKSLLLLLGVDRAADPLWIHFSITTWLLIVRPMLPLAQRPLNPERLPSQKHLPCLFSRVTAAWCTSTVTWYKAGFNSNSVNTISW